MGTAYLIFGLAVAVAAAFVLTIHQWLKAESDLAARH